MQARTALLRFATEALAALEPAGLNTGREARWLVEWAHEQALQAGLSLPLVSNGTSLPPLPPIPLLPDEESPLVDRWKAFLQHGLSRRLGREPLQYILGTASFHALPFSLRVTRDVLIPRFETEQLVDLVASSSPSCRLLAAPFLLDVGTGSGCLAMALSVAIPAARVAATDLSPSALSVAQHNAAKLSEHRCPGGGVAFLPPSHLLQWSVQQGLSFDVLVANLPYVSRPDHDSLQPEVRCWEPISALCPPPLNASSPLSFSSDDGLDLVIELLEEAPRVHAREVWLEHGHSEDVIRRLSSQKGYLRSFPDLTGRTRFSLFQFT